MNEPEPTWYQWKWQGRFFGWMWFHATFSVVYTCIALFPVIWFFIQREHLLCWVRGAPVSLLLWVFVASLGYPLWVWLETRRFEHWVRANCDEKNRSIERAYFKLMSDSARNFWSALLAIYSVGGLLGIAFGV